MRTDGDQIEVPPAMLEAWQEIVDILAEVASVPVSLIMRLRNPYIEVAVSSASQGNSYRPGDKEPFEGSGLYCETVIKTQNRLLIANALTDPAWDHNPDIKLGMVSYLGLPINLPDGRPFGTLCVLDTQPNGYSGTIERLMLNFRNLVQSNLEIAYLNQMLGDENRRLTDYLMELQALRGIVPICSYCKSIKGEDGHWRPIETYLVRHPRADFSHGICPKCLDKHFPELSGRLSEP